MQAIRTQLNNWRSAADQVGGIRCYLRQAIIFRCAIGTQHSVTFNYEHTGFMEPWYRNNNRGVNFMLSKSDVSKNNAYADSGALVDIACRNWLGKVIEYMLREKLLLLPEEETHYSEVVRLQFHPVINQLVADDYFTAGKLWDKLELNLDLQQFLDTKFDIV